MGSVTIRNPIQPLHGHTLAIRTVHRVGELVEVIVDHPGGGVLTLMGWAIDVRPPRSPRRVEKTLALFDTAQLALLLHRITALAATEPSARAQPLDSIPAPAPNLPPLSATPAGLVGHPPAQQMVFQEYVRAVTEHSERLGRLEQELHDQVHTWRLRPVVDALQALRGVQFTVAVTLVAELRDLSRFDKPSQLMRYLGLTPSEYSTGDHRRQGAITKTGNAHARRALIEGAWA